MDDPNQDPAAQPASSESGSHPLAPRKLRPPGMEDTPIEQAQEFQDVQEALPVAMVSPEVEDGHLHGYEGHDYGEAHELHAEWEGGTGERTFIVGEGEAVHAADKPPATKEKLSAVLTAVIVHLVIIIALASWYVASPPPPPPQISVSSLGNNTDASLENQTMKKMTQRSVSTVSATQPVVASSAFSNFSVPDTFDTNANLTMVAMSDSDAGFGMSMSGFGDVSNMAAIPAGMRSRCSMSQRMKRLRESGGEDRAERAVREGLEFLTKKQNKDGSFGEEYTAGMTGLALLAYLGHCETPESPKFGDSVVNAALFLMDRGLKNDGKITNGKGGHHEAYEHAIGTYGLSELYSMTKESGKEIPRLESVLKKAVGVIVDGQTKLGGWPYGFKGEGKEDMSVSGWQIQALKASYNTGRNFPGVERALDQAVGKYVPSIQDSEGAFKYNPDHAKGKPTLTGAALLAMHMWKGKDSPAYAKGIKYLAEKYKNPSPGGDFYAPYYNTQAFFMHEGEEWTNYNKQFQPRLLDAQNSDGSWLRDGGTRKDSQIMNTAWAILMLEVYYRYLPTTDKVSGLEKR
ncbi:MAG: terpene cyclase/mutase family protein [Verrucomicrobiae bacterium]|nr:terpene cyclase/mutase family protein [Verrucomicrobiae bacterium]